MKPLLTHSTPNSLMMFPGRGPGDMEAPTPTTTFALLEQAKGGDEQALSRRRRNCTP
jgi:hypothetical protein